MKSAFVFSGTVEGRKLVEKLISEGVFCHVFVATSYGEMVMEDNELFTVHVGRLTVDDMVANLQTLEPEKVYDATHPFARVVTDNIISACQIAGMEKLYKRIDREIVPVMKKVQECDISQEYLNKITVVTSVREAALFLVGEQNTNKDFGNILVATGVKDLNEYAEFDELKDYLIARIIPSVESLERCLGMGIKPGNIIAMKGPFSTEMNEAIIDEYAVKYLVTKNSGQKGGFEEKLMAAYNKSINIIVVEVV